MFKKLLRNYSDDEIAPSSQLHVTVSRCGEILESKMKKLLIFIVILLVNAALFSVEPSTIVKLRVIENHSEVILFKLENGSKMYIDSNQKNAKNLKTILLIAFALEKPIQYDINSSETIYLPGKEGDSNYLYKRVKLIYLSR